MPVVTFHLVQGQHDESALAQLLREASALFAARTDSPLERIRAFVVEHPPTHAAVGGRNVADGAGEAPFFEAILLADRPAEQGAAVLAGFTDLLVDLLGADRELVRGMIVRVDAADWAIAGVTADRLRANEIRARAAAG